MRHAGLDHGFIFVILVALIVGSLAASALESAAALDNQRPLRWPAERATPKSPNAPHEISLPLFASLERMSRIVDISYCVGNTGIGKPFSCISRCNEFPTLTLVTTWNTGPLLSDSCGYIAVDRGRAEDDGPSSRGGGPGAGTGAGIGAAADDDDDDAPHGPAVLVVFRGTYSIANMIVDLSTVPQEYVPYPAPDDGDGSKRPRYTCTNCTVHTGFLASWTNARRVVLPELRKLHLLYPDYPIRLVGHSLGGAVAALAALELRTSLEWEGVQVTTFGEPRVGNSGLARFVDDVFRLDGAAVDDPGRWRYRRVTHTGDPVPLLPLGEWGYRSHAGELYITKPDLSPSLADVRACDGDADEKCIASEDNTMLGLLPWFFENRHVVSPDEEMLPLREERAGFPTRFKLWNLFSSHRDYFWRLGLCLPGGDPFNWGRDRYDHGDEL